MPPFAQPKPCDNCPPAPWSSLSTGTHPCVPKGHRFPQLLHTKGPRLYSYRELPTQNVLVDSTCKCTPCPGPMWDRRQSLAGDISKYESGTKSQVPRPPWPRRPCQDSPGGGLRERESWGSGIRRQPGVGKHGPPPVETLQPCYGKKKDYPARSAPDQLPTTLAAGMRTPLPSQMCMN